MTGTVKWFNNKLGYGFITDETNKDHFVHYKDINIDGKYKCLSSKQAVTYDVVADEKGNTKAVNVCLV